MTFYIMKCVLPSQEPIESIAVATALQCRSCLNRSPPVTTAAQPWPHCCMVTVNSMLAALRVALVTDDEYVFVRQMAAVVGALASRFKISLGGSGGRKVTFQISFNPTPCLMLTHSLLQMMHTKLQDVGQRVPVCRPPSRCLEMKCRCWSSLGRAGAPDPRQRAAPGWRHAHDLRAARLHRLLQPDLTKSPLCRETLTG